LDLEEFKLFLEKEKFKLCNLTDDAKLLYSYVSKIIINLIQISGIFLDVVAEQHDFESFTKSYYHEDILKY
jgi:hypothetical protein